MRSLPESGKAHCYTVLKNLRNTIAYKVKELL